MKHGKKPTLRQKKLIQDTGRYSEDWLIVKDTPEVMIIQNRYDEKVVRPIWKELKK